MFAGRGIRPAAAAAAAAGASEMQHDLHDLFRHVSASFGFIYQRRAPGKGQSQGKPATLAAWT